MSHSWICESATSGTKIAAIVNGVSRAKIIVLSILVAIEDIFRRCRRGARAYFLKEVKGQTCSRDSGSQLRVSVITTNSRHVWLSEFRSAELRPRELEILRLIAKGEQQSDRQSWISAEGTVRSRRNIFAKLGCKTTRAQAVWEAFQRVDHCTSMSGTDFSKCPYAVALSYARQQALQSRSSNKPVRTTC